VFFFVDDDRRRPGRPAALMTPSTVLPMSDLCSISAVVSRPAALACENHICQCVCVSCHDRLSAPTLAMDASLKKFTFAEIERRVRERANVPAYRQTLMECQVSLVG
jgi:hypothetical protein